MLRDYAQARTEARALLDRFPDSPRAPQARFLQASSFEMEGRRAEAAAAFQELIDRAPASEAATAYNQWLARWFATDAARLSLLYRDLGAAGFGSIA